MDSIKVIKKLGSGVMGTTYLIEISQSSGKKRYICKIEKIWQMDVLYRCDAPLWREILFADFCKKHTDHFMVLKSWEIVDRCKHVQDKPEWKMDPRFAKNWKLRNKSPYCSKLLYEPVLDGTLLDVLMKKSIKIQHVISILAQVIYSINLLINEGYVHRDLHMNNIMFKKTTQKTIKLGSVDIKTFGLQWYLIDYGLILHRTFIQSWMDKVQQIQELDILTNEPYHDLTSFLFKFIGIPIWSLIEQKNMFDKIPNDTKLAGQIKKRQEFKDLKQYVPKVNARTADICTVLLFIINYPREYHELIGFGDVKYKKYIRNYDHIKDIYCNIIKRLAKTNLIIKYLQTLT